jgi:acyl dehydratase
MEESTTLGCTDVLYFEDHVPGSVFDCGTVSIEEEEIIEFAERYDPQPFHINAETARLTPFGGIVASGIHTLAAVTRLTVDHYLSRMANLGSPGLDEIRWLKPVRPRDTLSVKVTIQGTRRSQSKPDRGVVKSFVEVFNQSGEAVMSWKGLNIVRCRLSF